MGTHIRLARSTDHAVLLDLWERSVRATHTFLSAGDIEDLTPSVASELAGDATQWWVAAMGADSVTGRSETDSGGRAFPILHMIRPA